MDMGWTREQESQDRSAAMEDEYTQLCICGHTKDEHGANGTCQVEGCLCAGYERDEG
jgi:hypothetical protein